MTPLEYYQKKIAAEEILPDQQQFVVMQQFEAIYHALTQSNGFFRKKIVPKGMYLWGSVGIGKTFLVDTFYYCLPFVEKLRIHFYAFMQQIHAQLHALQGTKNPLQQIAKQWAKKYKIICFDELLVEDIVDAMVLGNLIQTFLAENICLVFTSNMAPDDLYKNGLQREQFLPAIDQIKNHLTITHLRTTEDYRENFSGFTQYYWYPLNARAEENMEKCFQQFSNQAPINVAPLVVNDREIHVVKQADGVVWFDFMAICGKPRSQEDYLVLVQRFHTILVGNVAPISLEENDLARSLIRFVDVLYDAKVRLIISAAQPIEKLYTAGILLFDFARTRSRLVQMQSLAWVESVEK